MVVTGRFAPLAPGRGNLATWGYATLHVSDVPTAATMGHAHVAGYVVPFVAMAVGGAPGAQCTRVQPSRFSQ